MILKRSSKKSILSSSKIDKYEYLTVVKILSSEQRGIIEQDKFAYSSIGKTFEKQTKTVAH